MDKIRAFLESDEIFSTKGFAMDYVNRKIFRLAEILSEESRISMWLKTQGDVTAPGHLHPYHIAVWMHGRCDIVGIDAALTELESAVAAPGPIIPIEAMLFDGLKFASSDEVVSFEFSNGIEFTARELSDEHFVFPSLDEFPLACILLETRESSDTFGERCLDICRMLSLVRSSDEAVQPNLFTKGWRKSAPFPQGRDIGYPRRPKMLLQSPVIAMEIRGADNLLQKFEKLSPKTRERIRTVLDHFSFAGSNVTLVEAAVHIRICLEAILMQSDKGDNAYKVSRRGAQMIGGELSQRLYNCKLLTKAYKAGSDAVHGAEVKSQERENWGQIQNVLRQLVRCWFDAGAPKLSSEQWVSIELGGSFPDGQPRDQNES